MKIATLNIDWARKTGAKKLELFLTEQNFDFLVLTEAIDLELNCFAYKYLSEQIPENIKYEDVDYTEYLGGKKAYRTIIYSKYPKVNNTDFQLNDNRTSLAVEFSTELGDFVLYATIVGTQFRKLPYAKDELNNCIEDCERIYLSHKNLIIMWDLNTSFLPSEKQYSISSDTTVALESLFQRLNLFNATKELAQNIDHIIIPSDFTSLLVESKEFVQKDILSDHKGVFVELKRSRA